MSFGCCCNCTEPVTKKANVTDLNGFYADYSFIDSGGTENFPYSGCVTGSPVLPFQHGDFSCASLSICNGGAYPVYTFNQTYAAAGTQDMDKCAEHGFKAVHGYRLWNGRYGFTDDYVTNPTGVTKRFLKRRAQVSYGEYYTGKQLDNTGKKATGNGSNSSSCDSWTSVEHNGVPQCDGSWG